jgi:predicted O-linked N-acetylglucosamine transferase (SPINDLY family)
MTGSQGALEAIDVALARADYAAARSALAPLLAVASPPPRALLQAAFLAAAIDDDIDAAIGWLTRCTAAAPQAAEPHFRLGTALLHAGRAAEALTPLARAATLAPNDLRVWRARVDALGRANGAVDELIEATGKVASLAPADAVHWLQHARALSIAQDAGRAHDAYARALAADPGNLAARWALFELPRHAVLDDAARRAEYLANWSTGVAWFRALDPAAHAPAQIEAALLSTTDIALHYLPGPLVAERRAHAAMVEHLARAIYRHRAPARRALRTRRRVGIVSAHWRKHVVYRIFHRMLRALAQADIELHLFHLDIRIDDASRDLQAVAAGWQQGPADPQTWLDRLHAADLDICLFADLGMDALSQILAAFRHAPVQGVLWGHPLTSGYGTSDWFLSADAIEPAAADHHYTETLLRLPGIGCDYPKPMKVPRMRRAGPGPHYLLAQTAAKLDVADYDRLADIALALPDATFTLAVSPRSRVRATVAERVQQAFARRGLAGDDRLTWLPYLGEREFLEAAAACDVNLDSSGWSGGVSTLDLLAQGLPTVCTDGATFRERQTAAQLELIGHRELVAADAQAMTQLAIDLGRDPGRRAALADALARDSGMLYDDARPAAALADWVRRVEPADRT